jgi:transcriptional regulator with XRE-family HTH domain
MMGRGTSAGKDGRTLANDTVRQLSMQFGMWLREQRLKRGLTQKQLAEMVGTTDNHISDIENGIRKMSPERYPQFAKILGVPREEFIKRVLFAYDPFSYRMLWPGKHIENLLSGVPERISEAMATEKRD